MHCTIFIWSGFMFLHTSSPVFSRCWKYIPDFMFSELNNAQITIDILGHSFMWCFIIRNLDSRNIPGATFQMAPEVSRRNILQQENVDYLGEGISWCWTHKNFYSWRKGAWPWYKTLKSELWVFLRCVRDSTASSYFFLLQRGATFSMKGQIVNISGFMSYPVSVTTICLSCSMKASRDYK